MPSNCAPQMGLPTHLVNHLLHLLGKLYFIVTNSLPGSGICLCSHHRLTHLDFFRFAIVFLSFAQVATIFAFRVRIGSHLETLT